MAGQVAQVPPDAPPVILTAPEPPVADPKAATSEAALSAALNAPPQDDFADFFKQFADAENPVAKKEPGAEDAPAATGDEPATEIVPPEDDAAALAAAKAAEDAAKARDSDLSRLADLIQERQQAQPQPQPQRQQAPAQPQMYAPQEVQALQNFYQEWPEVAQASQLLLRGAMFNVTQHILSEIAKEIGPRLGLLDQLADRVAYDGLTKAIPDYDNLGTEVEAWVKTRPAYLQPAYYNVMQQGSEDEIIGLVNEFRQATGKAAPTQAAPGQPPAKQAAGLSDAAKKAVAALAPVNSKRSVPAQGAPSGFDDAFKQAVKELA